MIAGVRGRTASLTVAGVAGLLFGVGLLISGMTQPARVIGFLDVAHGWDPSLGFVMAGAVAVYGAAFRWFYRPRTRPWFDGAFHMPTRADVDAPLLVGAAVFGVGWGLGGLCPGPGVVAAGSGATSGLAFVTAMAIGMLLQHAISSRRGTGSPRRPSSAPIRGAGVAS